MYASHTYFSAIFDQLRYPRKTKLLGYLRFMGLSLPKSAYLITATPLQRGNDTSFLHL